MTKKVNQPPQVPKKTKYCTKDKPKETLQTSKSRGRPKKVVPPSVEGKKEM